MAEWSQQAANAAGEVCAIPYETLARVLVGSVMGMVMQYLANRDRARSQHDLDALTNLLIGLTVVRPAPSTTK